MTEPFDEYGERLRRVLHAEAEAVTPSPEGLAQIRGKITTRRERRFGVWFMMPWLRPLAAVAAAIVIAGVAVSATPALKTFVQTGRFSPETRQDGGTSVAGGEQVVTASPPANPLSHSGPSAAPRPTPSRTSSGTHVIPGRKCPPGEDPIKSPAGTVGGETASTAPKPQVTCSPDPVTSAPPTQVASPPPATSPAQVPTSDAPTGGPQQPSTQSSP
ncbi:MAG: hypothetical protein ACJ72W_02515 [Actinoallomurus sp.]